MLEPEDYKKVVERERQGMRNLYRSAEGAIEEDMFTHLGVHEYGLASASAGGKTMPCRLGQDREQKVEDFGGYIRAKTLLFLLLRRLTCRIVKLCRADTNACAGISQYTETRNQCVDA